jgi:hypothetical protein
MKTIARILFLSLTLGFMTMCSDDDDPASSGDPNEFCTGGLCDNAAAKQQCIDAYNNCKAVDQGDDEECKVIARGVCNL